MSIHRFVNKGQTLTIHRNTREFKELNKDDIVLPTEKIKSPHVPPLPSTARRCAPCRMTA
ncbi:MAG: hypothetical protein ACLUNO_12480 [Oscillospiraceae bacterium]